MNDETSGSRKPDHSVPGLLIFEFVRPIYKLFYFSYRATSGLWYWAAAAVHAGGIVRGRRLRRRRRDGHGHREHGHLPVVLAAAGVADCWPARSCFFFRAKFSATRFLPRFGTAGQPLHYRVQVKNLTAKAQTGLTLLEDLADPRPPFDEWLAFQMAESRRVRPFRVAQRRRRNPFRLAKLKEAEVPPLLAERRRSKRAWKFCRCGGGSCVSPA